MANTNLGEQGTAGSRSLAGHGITTGRAARIAWHRARGLSMVSRVPGLGKVIAPWLWPMHLAVVAGQSGQISYQNSASMAIDDGDRHPIHRPAMALAAAALLTQFVLLVTAGTAAATMLLPFMSPARGGGDGTPRPRVAAPAGRPGPCRDQADPRPGIADPQSAPPPAR
ncbi:MAG TPA: hypothetical protein VFC03_06050 [Acidimicrobiales bacterium]|nr:hypothetical protein [Acidimicrobiales bacterium]